MSIQKFLRSEDTELALRVVIGGGIPLLVLGFFGFQREALMVMIGSTFISGIDIPAELPRKLKLMSFSLIASPLIFATVSYASTIPVALFIILAVFIFLISFIAPFGFHFGKVAFMFNLAIMVALGFSVNMESTEGVLRSALLIFGGGLWYMAFASLMHFLLRPTQISRRISDVFQATSEYFEARSAFFEKGKDETLVSLNLAEKQAKLTDQHENVRAVLMRDFHYSSKINAPIGRLVHIFAALVDLFDEALATSWKIQETTDIMEDTSFHQLLFEVNTSIAKVLAQMGEYLNGGRPIGELLDMRQKIQDKTRSMEATLAEMEHQSTGDSAGTGFYDFKTIQIYIDAQMNTLSFIVDLLEGTAKKPQWGIKEKDLPFFETRDQVRLEQMYSHFTFQSGYFRYALRVTITALIAYFFTKSLGFQHPHWAILTVLVILKPGYRVSRDRMIRRVIGTSAGVVIAYILFTLLSPNHFLSQILFLLAFFGGFAFANTNYAVASSFFTIYILFIYAFLDRSMEISAFFRMSNTILAAILSIFSIRFLFPYWENRNMKYFLVESLSATYDYLTNIFDELKKENKDLIRYKIGRKDAHLAMGKLTHSYQRILSEPKSKQGDVKEFSAWVLAASSLLSVSSNLGIFLRREPDYILDQPYLIDHFQSFLDYFKEIIDSIRATDPGEPDRRHAIEEIRKLKHDHDRLKNETRRLAHGYTAIYVARIHEYFIVHELLSLYHLVEHLDIRTRDSRILHTSQINIEYN